MVCQVQEQAHHGDTLHLGHEPQFRADDVERVVALCAIAHAALALRVAVATSARPGEWSSRHSKGGKAARLYRLCRKQSPARAENAATSQLFRISDRCIREVVSSFALRLSGQSNTQNV